MAVFGLVVFVWVVLTVLELALGIGSIPAGVIATERWMLLGIKERAERAQAVDTAGTS